MGQYGNEEDDYGEDDDDAEVSVTYNACYAAEAILSGEALGANVLIVEPPPRRGLCPDILSKLCRYLNPNQTRVGCIGHLPPEYGQRLESINQVNGVTTLIYVSCGFDALARDIYRLLSLGGGG